MKYKSFLRSAYLCLKELPDVFTLKDLTNLLDLTDRQVRTYVAFLHNHRFIMVVLGQRPAKYLKLENPKTYRSFLNHVSEIEEELLAK